MKTPRTRPEAHPPHRSTPHQRPHVGKTANGVKSIATADSSHDGRHPRPTNRTPRPHDDGRCSAHHASNAAAPPTLLPGRVVRESASIGGGTAELRPPARPAGSTVLGTTTHLAGGGPPDPRQSRCARLPHTPRPASRRTAWGRRPPQGSLAALGQSRSAALRSCIGLRPAGGLPPFPAAAAAGARRGGPSRPWFASAVRRRSTPAAAGGAGGPAAGVCPPSPHSSHTNGRPAEYRRPTRTNTPRLPRRPRHENGRPNSLLSLRAV